MFITNKHNVNEQPCEEASIWEKEVLCWVSSQFCLYWHAGYSQCVILTGDASRMKSEIRRLEFSKKFLASVEEMPDEMRRRYLATDFSPRVEMADGRPRIIYHVYTPFGGIFQEVACEESPDDMKAVFPYECGVCY